MSLRTIVFALVAVVAVVAVVACGPSAAQINTARTARYRTTASAAFQAGVAALTSNDYKVAAADAVAGKAQSVPRWYEADGTFVNTNADNQVIMKDGMVVLTLEVGVVADGDSFRVEVTPIANQFRDGYSATFPLKPDDAAMSSWIAGKVDSVYISIYDRLKKDAVVPGA